VLLDGQAPVGDLKWSPDGRMLAVSRGGKLILLGGQAILVGGEPILRELPAPGPVLDFWWSPDSACIAMLFLDGSQWDAGVVHVASRQLTWRSRTHDWEHGLAWLGSDKLSVVRISEDASLREYLVVDLKDGSEEVLEREMSPRSLKPEVVPVAAPTGDAAAYTLLVEGWAHLVVRDFARGTRTVVLQGDSEDYGHADDRPAWSGDGRYVAFASNYGVLQQRHLWRFDRETGEVRQLTSEPGTHVNPAFAPDGKLIACIACSPWRSAEVALLPADGTGGGKVERLTNSMPAAWVREAITEPQHITITGAEGLQVHADLFVPRGFDPAKQYPALVYIHGGPVRQMRCGWHPMHAYGFFYSYNQYLLHQGYVILSVDYRGGSGYGVAYEQANYMKFAQTELDDCVRGGRYLKSLPYVDEDRVGIWGISYGGYMALAAMTKRPDEFALGVNIAGVWDFEQWDRWLAGRQPGLPRFYETRWGGPKGEHNAEVYRQQSPRYFVEGLKGPLLNLHGTADESVDFAQLDAIVKDCTEHGKDFAAIYYPGETHLFHNRKTWADAFRRMDGAFERYLKCEDPARRPAAMI
ncbi:MAG: peptidase prolyl oligopeptidase active site domain protein, partial [Firmicutes bacterium]|nr:peptidase prolyl oligopeptidase active site domain protein [Bacillota bacterium]